MTFRQVFKKLDIDKSGYLTREEITDAFDVEKVGIEIPVKKKGEILTALDDNSDGKVICIVLVSFVGLIINLLFFNATKISPAAKKTEL